MKLCDPDLDRQLKASTDRYEQLPAWVKVSAERYDPPKEANAKHDLPPVVDGDDQ